MIGDGGRCTGCTSRSSTRAPFRGKRRTSKRIVCSLYFLRLEIGSQCRRCSSGAAWLRAGSEQTRRAALSWIRCILLRTATLQFTKSPLSVSSNNNCIQEITWKHLIQSTVVRRENRVWFDNLSHYNDLRWPYFGFGKLSVHGYPAPVHQLVHKQSHISTKRHNTMTLCKHIPFFQLWWCGFVLHWNCCYCSYLCLIAWHKTLRQTFWDAEIFLYLY